MSKEKPASPIEQIDEALNKILKDAQQSISRVVKERAEAKDAILARREKEDAAREGSLKPPSS